MSFAPTEAMMAYLQKLQAEGKLIVPTDLVRMVKTGPGTASLGEARRAGALQAQEQQGIEADTLAAVARLENAWTGQGGDAARDGLRPLAQAAIQLNERNAAIQRNNEIYNSFTRTSDGHAQAKPVEFGQITGESDGPSPSARPRALVAPWRSGRSRDLPCVGR
ncbi:hypothetical protein [Amycolatopsis sp. cmx-11-32]|uniref:hypothetical protein n=1 Tax=Amycolatopsis sp. cmx-11-32 TaxID=2785796 RepID=UPI0039E37955